MKKLKKEKYLITTSLEKVFVKQNERVYLGDWCLNSDDLIKSKDNHVLKSIFLNNYSSYLEGVITRLSESIASFLKLQSKENLSKKFWKNLTWIWLSYYVSSNFYRWKKIENIHKKKNYKFIDFNFDSHFYYNDVNAYNDLASNSDIFNYITIRKILYFLNFKRKKKFFQNKPDDKEEKKYVFKKKFFLKNYVLKLYSNIFSYILRNNKILLPTVFSSKNLIKISFKLGQLPQFFSSYFHNDSFYRILKKKIKRSNKKFIFSSHNKFESFLKENIINDIPLIYYENFSETFKKIKQITINPKIIMTGGEHYHNECFKIWALYQKEKFNKKILSIEHGGAHQIDSHQFDYENTFCNGYISWIKENNLKNISNPKIYYNFIKNIKKTKIIYIGYERSKYPSRLCNSQVYEISNLNSCKNIKVLKKKLNMDNQRIFYSPKFIKDERVKKNIIKILGKNNILKNNSFKKNLINSKYVICEYPQTAYIESFLVTPTFLVCDINKIFKPKPKLKNLYELLLKNNLAFKDMIKFTKFINKNSKNINEFWSQPQIKRIRKRFKNTFSINSKENLLISWTQFLQKYN